MTKKFLIAGDIIDTDAQRMSFEDVTPSQVNAFIKNLDKDDELVFEFNSCGGSCTAGITIGNMIKKASSEGHKTTARVIGLCASIASYIACCCDKLEICSNAFLMIHKPWTTVQGNAKDLESEIKNLNLFEEALVAVYKTKFAMTDEEIKTMLSAETWILGKDAKSYKLMCEIIQVDSELKIAARYTKSLNKFNNKPRLDMENKEEIKETIDKTEEVVVDSVVKSETDEEKKEETKTTDEPKKTVEEFEKEIQKLIDENEQLKAELDKKNSETVEDRVSGMQSTMQAKINALVKDHTEKISNYENEIKVRDEKLAKYENEAISLRNELEKTNNELQKTVSALSEKQSALDSLTSGVLTPPAEQAVDWRNLKGHDFFDYLKKHPELAK